MYHNFLIIAFSLSKRTGQLSNILIDWHKHQNFASMPDALFGHVFLCINILKYYLCNLKFVKGKNGDCS